MKSLKITIYIIAILSSLAIARTALAAQPTVTTQSASDVTSSTATGNGNITNTGGENNDVRGFVYTADDGSRAAHYKFESSGTLTTDSSGNGNTLTNVNTATASTTDYMQGVGSTEIELGSSEYYNIADADLSSNFPLKSGTSNKTITICAWFKAESLVTDTLEVNTLVSKVDTSSNRRSLGMRINYYGGVYHKLDLLLGYNSGGDSEIKSHGSAISTGVWYHATLSFRDSDKYYALRLRDVDGNVIGSDIVSTTTNNISLTTEDWRIGAQFAGGSLYSGSRFDGLIDDVMIFDRFLTADEVTAIAKGNVAPGSSGYDYYAEDSGTYGTGAFTKSLTGLDPETTYFMRAYSHNSEGYSYGDEISFTTEAPPATADTKFTVSAWVKPTVSIASKAIAVKNNEIRLVTDAGGHPACQIHDGTSWLTAATSSQALELGRWAYVSCTYDASNIKIYINGFAVASQAETSSIANTANGWFFGDDPGGTYGDYQGFMDEVKIYPYARTIEQVLADYAAGLAGQSTNSGVSAAFGSISDKWLTDGLVGYWQMDEAIGTYDDDNGFEDAIDSSGSGNTGDANGNASTTVGKFGNGGIFDGTGDYIASILSTNISTSSFTVSGWIYQDSAAQKTWLSLGNEESDNNLLHLRIYADGHLRMANYNNDMNTAAGVFSAGTWQHVVYTYDKNSGSRNIYLNGEEKASDISSSDYEGNNSLSIGRDTEAGGIEYWNGKIDEVRVYNRALSADEVRKLYEWAPGPVAHWRMDEKTGNSAYDISGNEYNGQLGLQTTTSSSSPSWARGKYGSALDFDGTNDYVDIGNPPGLNNIAEKTISAWIKMDSFGGANGGRIIEKEHGLAGGWFFSVYGGTALGNQYSIRYLHHFTGAADYGVWTSATNTISVGDWYHVAVTFNNNSGTNIPTFYINGIAQTTTIFRPTTGISLDDSASAPYIGKRADEVVSFNGKIDDVRIYNYARTQKQILDDMHAGAPGPHPFLYLKFDEGKGETAYDSSIYANSGTLTPGASGGNTTASAMWTLDGKFGKAIEFDGTNDYIDIGTPSSLTDFNSLTLSAWVKLNSIPTAVNTIISKYASSPNRGWRLQASGDITPKTWTISLSTDGTDFQPYRHSASTLTTEWTHVAAIYDAARQTLDIYVNGALNNGPITGTIPSSQFNSTASINVGRVSTNDWFFDGLMDEVKIYNYALSAEEIKKDFNQGMAAVIGSLGGPSSGGTATSSNASSLEYCVPGSDDECRPPVGEWKFDEKATNTAYDISGNGYNGQLGILTTTSSSSPAWTRGKFGSALDFDGVNDVVRMGDVLDFTSANMTLSAWINPDGWGGSSYGRIIDKDNMGATGYQFLVLSSGRLNFSAVSSGADISSDAGSVVLNKWQHVVMTYDGSNARFYVNGQLKGAPALTEVPSNTSHIFAIGNRATYLDRGFNGKIDQVRIYNYVRTPAQVAYDFNGGKPIALWRFDECKGGAIYDSAVSWNGATSSNGTLNLGTSGVTATGTCASSSNSFWSNGSSGKKNSSASFDGTDDKIVIGSQLIFDNMGPMTWSAWVYPEDIIDEYDVITKADMSYTGRFFGVYQSRVRFSVWRNSVSYFIRSTEIISPSTWQHILVTWDGNLTSQAKLYYNGREVDYSDVTLGSGTVADDASNDLIIGNRPTNDALWNGLIDEVKIWNYALTAEQVKQDYAGGAVRFGN